MKPSRQLPRVEQFHAKRYWPADSALACLPFADGAEITDPQAVSKTGLRKTGSLADCFESGRGHRTRPFDSRQAFSCAPSFKADSDVRKSLRVFGSVSSSIISASSRMMPLSRLSAKRLTANQCGPTSSRLDVGGLPVGHAGSERNLNDRLAIACAIVAANNPTSVAGLDVADGFEGLGHFHSPVSGGARPRADKHWIGPLGLLSKHNRTRFVANHTQGEG